ncbi:MAG: hypothetical protein M1817_000131 [Caeruleum heppii]|nr:MAG: hypothetical protein M1817_000131 [Caeruleum heppii]
MSTHPGEELALTVYADVHFYLGDPTERRPHHRFEKGSYVYLYRTPSEGKARVQVANNAGTSHQDACSGPLDGAHLCYSHRQPAMVTLTPNGASSAPSDPRAWQLPSPDQRGDGMYSYPVHTVDLYFWTTEDATHFLDIVKGIMPPHQQKILDAPPPSAAPAAPAPHQDVMSPVVQQLEHAAITESGGRHTASTSSTSYAPPPSHPASHSPAIGSPSAHEAPADYAPMAYNPAAPAAPEPIKHREKTPPPPEAEGGTGLANVAYQDSVQPAAHPGYPPQHGSYASPPPQHPQAQYFGAPQQAPQQPGFPGPPTPAGSLHGSQPSPVLSHSQMNRVGSFPPPPPSQGHPTTSPRPDQQHAPSFTGPGAFAGTPQYGGAPAPSPQPPLTSPQFANYPQSPGFQPPPTHQQPPPPPVGGYSPFQYTATQPLQQQQPGTPGQPPHASQQAPQSNPNDPYHYHTQAYRPTAAEAGHAHGVAHGGVGQPGPGQQGGRFEGQAARVEKKVGGFLKKLEKKIG